MTEKEMAEEYANNEINKMFVDESEEVYVRASTLKQIIKNSHLKGLKVFESHCDEIEEDAKVIAKENAELKEKVSYLEDNLRVARKDRENLQLKVGKGLKEFIKDCPYSALKLYANGYYVEQLTKAKELIGELISSLSVVGECEEEECELLNRAEQFLNSEVE